MDRQSNQVSGFMLLIVGFFSEFPSEPQSVLGVRFLRTEWTIPDGFLRERHGQELSSS